MNATKVDQIADRIYRISTCIPELAPGGFTFNQFVIDAEEPLLYHTGMRQLFPVVREAVEMVLPVERLRWVTFAPSRPMSAAPSTTSSRWHRTPRWPMARSG